MAFKVSKELADLLNKVSEEVSKWEPWQRSLDPLGTPEGQRAMNQAIDDFNRY
jgi:hypothetical protein